MTHALEDGKREGAKGKRNYQVSEAAVRICSSKEVFLGISQYSQETPVLEYHFNKVAGLNFFKKRLQHRCFPVNNAKFLRVAFL